MGSFFSTPARQAAGWAALGVLGLLLATAGAWFVLDDDDGGAPALPAAVATATHSATTTPTPRATSTASPTPTPEPSPTVVSTSVAAARELPVSAASTPEATQEPTAEPTPEPVASAGGPYCPSVSATATGGSAARATAAT